MRLHSTVGWRLAPQTDVGKGTLGENPRIAYSGFERAKKTAATPLPGETAFSVKNESYAGFLGEFLRKPMTVGAIAPSSSRLAEEILRGVGLSEASVIVEYGPGTGVFTQKILAKKRDGARLIAVEKNPKFAAHLRYRFPAVELLEGSVTDLPSALAGKQIEHVDCVVSGLPWASFSGREQVQLLRATDAVLRPGGRFVTFAYIHGLLLPEARRFRERLRRQFRRVRISRVVWQNLPPAFVYRCVR